MATSADNTATLSVLVQTWFSKKFIPRVEKSLYLEQYATDTIIPKFNGDEVKWTLFTNFSAASALTEAETPTANNVSATQVSATLEQYGSYVIRSDMLSWVELMGTAREVVELFAYQAALTIDTRIRDALYGTSSVPSGAKFGLIYPASIGNLSTVTAAHNPTTSTVNEVARQLRAGDVKPFPDGYYRMLVHTNVAHQLMDDTTWAKWDGHVGQVEKLERGMVGAQYGIKVFDSTNVGFTTSGTGTPGTVSAYFNIAFGMDSFAVAKVDGHYLETIMKPLGSAGADDPLNQRSTVGWKVTFVPQVLATGRGKIVVTGD